MTSAQSRIAIVTGDVAADGRAIAGHLVADGTVVVLGTSDLESASEIARDASDVGRHEQLKYTFVDNYHQESISRIGVEIGNLTGRVETWIHCVDARDATRFSERDFTFCSTVFAEVDTLLASANDLSNQDGVAVRFVVHLKLCDNETAMSDVLTDGISALLRVHKNLHCRTNLVVVSEKDFAKATGDEATATTCFLAGPDSSGLAGGRFDVVPSVDASKPADIEDSKREQFDHEVLKRVAKAGFASRDAASRYWQRPYQPPDVALQKAFETNANSSRIVLIAGVSRGIGLEASREFARRGHRVIGCARNRSAVEALAAELGSRHDVQSVDITNDAAVASWATDVIDRVGTPDLVLNVAAITNSLKQTWRIDAAEFEDVLRINVLGTTNVVRHFVPAMIAQRNGVIVNFSSAMGRMTSEKSSPYCASKWAIEGLTGALSKELPRSLAALTLHPGNIQTDAMAASFGESAALYPTAAQWARVAVPYLLQLGPSDNGQQLSVPGMTAFRGIGPLRRGTAFTIGDVANARRR